MALSFPVIGPPRTLSFRTVTMLLAVSIALPVAGAAVLLLDRLGDDGRAARLQHLRDLAQLYASRVDREFDADLDALQVLAVTLPAHAASPAELRVRIANAADAHPSLDSLQLVDGDGRPLVRLADEVATAGRPTLEPAWLQNIITSGRSSVGLLQQGPSGWVVPLGVPVALPDGRLGVLAASLPADQLQRTIVNGMMGDGVWSRTITDPSGRVAVRSRESDRFVGQPQPEEVTRLQRASADGLQQRQSLDGRAVYVAHHRGSRHGWTATASAMVDTVEAPWRSSVLAMATLLFGCMGLTLLLAWLFATRVSRGLDRITASAEMLSVGGTPPALDLGIREVARTSAALDRSRRLLQAREAERDAHLLDAEEARRAAEEARLSADRAARAKDEFLAVLGHELRNPLAPMVTALDLLRSRGEAGTPEHDVLTRQVRHLTRLVDDLLDVSRIAQGKVALRRERLDLCEILRQAAEVAAPLFLQQHQSLHVEVGHEALPVFGDRARLTQVVSNLLMNAAKYTPAGGTVWLRARLDASHAVVEVQDTGQGIPASLLPHVFDLFVQGRQNADRQDGGLGLGLTIVRQMVTLHGGTVGATSEGPGRGSTFTVRLPLAQVKERRENGDVDASEIRPLRILVVDDNRDAAELLERLLATDGHSVAAAHDGPAALALAAHSKPEVALLDLGLPGMSGEELGRALTVMGPDAPRTVAITGYGRLVDAERTRAAGFAAHLLKPVAHDTLRRVLAELAAGGRRTGSAAG